MTLFAFTGVQLSANGIVKIPFSVPAPTAIWLFGVGLIGLIGFNTRRKAAWLLDMSYYSTGWPD